MEYVLFAGIALASISYIGEKVNNLVVALVKGD